MVVLLGAPPPCAVAVAPTLSASTETPTMSFRWAIEIPFLPDPVRHVRTSGNGPPEGAASTSVAQRRPGSGPQPTIGRGPGAGGISAGATRRRRGDRS